MMTSRKKFLESSSGWFNQNGKNWVVCRVPRMRDELLIVGTTQMLVIRSARRSVSTWAATARNQTRTTLFGSIHVNDSQSLSRG